MSDRGREPYLPGGEDWLVPPLTRLGRLAATANGRMDMDLGGTCPWSVCVCFGKPEEKHFWHSLHE